MIIIITYYVHPCIGLPGGTVAKNPPANAGDAGSVPEWGRSPGEENGYPLQYCCLENPTDRGAWLAPVLYCSETTEVASSRKASLILQVQDKQGPLLRDPFCLAEKGEVGEPGTFRQAQVTCL